jgi:hypothetical protein
VNFCAGNEISFTQLSVLQIREMTQIETIFKSLKYATLEVPNVKTTVYRQAMPCI